jgi:capsular polysaccharide biosynthesis protein
MEEIKKIGRILGKKAGIIILGGVLVGALSFAFLVVSQKNFKVTTQFLIVQDQKTGPQDFFSLSKSVDYNGKVMSEAVYSELFIDEVVKTEKVNSEFLPFNKKDRLKEWSKMVSVSRDPQLGLITITIFNNKQSEALNISDGVIQVLSQKSYLFRGSGQDIDFRVISGPISEENPSLTQILVTVLGGLALGMIITLVWNYYKDENTDDGYKESLDFIEIK